MALVFFMTLLLALPRLVSLRGHACSLAYVQEVLRVVVLHCHIDIGFVPGVNTAPAKLVYLLGADDTVEGEIPDDAFVIYQGHHGM